MTDMVNRPPHYNKGLVECIDCIAAATENLTGIEAVCTANAIKYLYRGKKKAEYKTSKKLNGTLTT